MFPCMKAYKMCSRVLASHTWACRLLDSHRECVEHGSSCVLVVVDIREQGWLLLLLQGCPVQASRGDDWVGGSTTVGRDAAAGPADGAA
jgi:hypothetical protein